MRPRPEKFGLRGTNLPLSVGSVAAMLLVNPDLVGETEMFVRALHGCVCEVRLSCGAESSRPEIVLPTNRTFRRPLASGTV
jgi:hypothetical protein